MIASKVDSPPGLYAQIQNETIQNRCLIAQTALFALGSLTGFKGTSAFLIRCLTLNSLASTGFEAGTPRFAKVVRMFGLVFGVLATLRSSPHFWETNSSLPLFYKASLIASVADIGLRLFEIKRALQEGDTRRLGTGVALLLMDSVALLSQLQRSYPVMIVACVISGLFMVARSLQTRSSQESFYYGLMGIFSLIQASSLHTACREIERRSYFIVQNPNNVPAQISGAFYKDFGTVGPHGRIALDVPTEDAFRDGGGRRWVWVDPKLSGYHPHQVSAGRYGHSLESMQNVNIQAAELPLVTLVSHSVIGERLNGGGKQKASV